jgi:NAD(P)-dependent dehydrogenase (short-subunit alcohol dehydrogenase family)
MATRRDLDETVNLVEKAGGRIAAFVADVRDLASLRDALARGEEQLGNGADIVVANAGIFPVGGPEPDPDRTFRDVVEVNLTGTWNTVSVTAPGLIERGRGGSIMLTSSTQGLVGRGGDGSGGLAGQRRGTLRHRCRAAGRRRVDRSLTHPYHGRFPDRSMNCPVGPSGPIVARVTMGSAPTAALCPRPLVKSVAVCPGSTALILRSFSSLAYCVVSIVTAAFEAQ